MITLTPKIPCNETLNIIQATLMIPATKPVFAISFPSQSVPFPCFNGMAPKIIAKIGKTISTLLANGRLINAYQRQNGM